MTYNEICEKILEAKTRMEETGVEPNTVILSFDNAITLFGMNIAVADLQAGHEFIVERIPRTNADRIRAMSDSELAEMFDRAEESGSKYGQAGKEWWLMWLTSEVET